jgi:hypothetical protein
MIVMELTRKGKKRRIDALAAAEILQAFLDSKKSHIEHLTAEAAETAENISHKKAQKF